MEEAIISTHGSKCMMCSRTKLFVDRRAYLQHRKAKHTTSSSFDLLIQIQEQSKSITKLNEKINNLTLLVRELSGFVKPVVSPVVDDKANLDTNGVTKICNHSACGKFSSSGKQNEAENSDEELYRAAMRISLTTVD